MVGKSGGCRSVDLFILGQARRIFFGSSLLKKQVSHCLLRGSLAYISSWVLINTQHVKSVWIKSSMVRSMTNFAFFLEDARRQDCYTGQSLRRLATVFLLPFVYLILLISFTLLVPKQSGDTGCWNSIRRLSQCYGHVMSLTSGGRVVDRSAGKGSPSDLQEMECCQWAKRWPIRLYAETGEGVISCTMNFFYDNFFWFAWHAFFGSLNGFVGSITSRCSGNEPALLFSGNVVQTRESGGNRA